MNTGNGKRIIGRKELFAGLGILLFFVFGFLLRVPDVLEQSAQSNGYSGHSAMVVLAGLIWAICWWASGIIPDWCTALLLQGIFIAVAKIPFASAFGAFSKSTLWLMIGTFCIAAAISKTGLLRRISLNLMKLFPPNFRGQTLALLVVGAVCGPLMPSSTAKALLGGKLAYSNADLLEYEHNSRGRVGLFMAAWTGFYLIEPMFMSSSFMAYSMIGSLPEGHSEISWGQWFVAMLPWSIMMLVGMYFVVKLLYNPKEQRAFSAEYIRGECRALGKMGRQEKITAIILCICLAFWILEKRTGISAGLVALMGGMLCFATGVLERREISTSINWGFTLFVGVVLNMGDIFISVGISNWLLHLFDPILTRINSPVLLVILFFSITVAMRFLLSSQTAVLALLTGVFSTVALATGMHPFIAGLVIYTAIPVCILYFQNPSYLATIQSMDGTVEHSYTVKGHVLYLLVALSACLLSIPYWQLLGYQK